MPRTPRLPRPPRSPARRFGCISIKFDDGIRIARKRVHRTQVALRSRLRLTLHIYQRRLAEQHLTALTRLCGAINNV